MIVTTPLKSRYSILNSENTTRCRRIDVQSSREIFPDYLLNCLSYFAFAAPLAYSMRLDRSIGKCKHLDYFNSLSYTFQILVRPLHLVEMKKGISIVFPSPVSNLLYRSLFIIKCCNDNIFDTDTLSSKHCSVTNGRKCWLLTSQINIDHPSPLLFKLSLDLFSKLRKCQLNVNLNMSCCVG